MSSLYIFEILSYIQKKKTIFTFAVYLLFVQHINFYNSILLYWCIFAQCFIAECTKQRPGLETTSQPTTAPCCSFQSPNLDQSRLCFLYTAQLYWYASLCLGFLFPPLFVNHPYCYMNIFFPYSIPLGIWLF